MAPRRKKAESSAPAAFTVGEPDPAASVESERSPLQEETVDGLLDLRGHLEQRVPGGLLWPLQTLPSMSQHMSDLESAREAVDRLAVRHALSNDKMAELRRFLLSDAYAFAYLVCGHRDIVPEVHMPLAYAAAGQAQRLAWCLSQSGLKGYVIDRFREACVIRGIDITTAYGVGQLDVALDWVNFRLPRGTYKSSIITHTGVVITATADPNRTIKITGAIDDKAWELCEQAGDTVLSGIYRDLFPERVPAKSDVTMKKIKLAGRNVSSREKTIQAGGYLSKNETGGHYSDHFIDDLVVGGKNGNANPTQLPGAINWLVNLPNTFMISTRVRVVHGGTRWDQKDDHGWLSEKTRASDCMSVVVPIETYEKPPASIMERGTPTMPTFLPVEKIQAKQDRMLASDDEIDAAEAWRCNNLLDPSAGGGRLFVEDVVNDHDRTWLGPFEHPEAKIRERSKIDYAARFVVAKIERDATGAPIHKDTKKPLDINEPRWRSAARIASYDPWEDMDVVVALDPTWNAGGQKWAATVAAVDPDLVKFQLETRSGESGVDEWATALAALEKTYKPRVIGIARKALSDPLVQNLVKTDERLRKLRGKIVAVEHVEATQESRVRAGVADPLKAYRWLLLPVGRDSQNDYGAAVTRREMLRYRAGSESPWPVLESLAMVDALARRVPTRDQREKTARARQEAEARYRASINPVLGVPSAA